MNTKYAQPGLAREPEAVASSNPFRKYQVITVSLLLVIGIINYVDRSALSIANTSIQRDMGITPSQMGILLSAFSLAYAFSQLPLGMIIDRLGSKISLGAALLGWSVAQTASGLINSFSAFIGLRVVLGIGEAPMFPSAAKALAEWFEAEKRGTPTGIVLSSTCIGPCLAPPLLTLLMVTWGWRGMFIVTGVFGILVAACWFAFYKSKARYLAELPAEAREQLLAAQAHKQAVPSARPSVQAQLAAWAELFRHKSTWGAVLGFMGVIYMLWLHLTWLPGYFEREHGLSLYQTAWVVSLAYVFGALGTIVAGRICDRLVKNGASVLGSRKRVVVTALFAAAAFTVPLSFGSGFLLSVALLCCALFSVNMASSTAWMIANTVVDSQRVASFGSIQNFGGYLAGSVAPIVTGFSIQQTGSFASAFLISAAVAAVAAMAYVLLLKQPVSTDC
ncbi:major facilitator family transporter [Pseudomonas putida TRO1]|uniref:Major facilitator family transporter n=1 Tax=Pseudomonas putida TRO1 TaxID=1227924 RepID=A0AAD2WGG4_PSEPU|nr:MULTISPECIES: MFS transporter [Pseudomonas]ELS0922661.1 MFS transporter [Pseudomonas putida]ENY79496.1 major facilitator family transporter [Pseudomonas putida TRO1]PKF28408.1 MFS transporter [Pseudomonas hunanensis]UWH25080.1 MFS transporter [Pseudomonas sp. HD6515]HDS0940459.1 MFS transporter [Pseudomonas putida]